MNNKENNKAINIVLWIAQVILAAMFIMAGAMKASQPLEVLMESLPWVSETPLGLVRFIGVSELLGGIGILLPAVLRIKPSLTVLAGLGLALIMVFAAVFHGSRGEFSAIGVNLFIGAIAAFVAWGRSKKAPILPKA